jgi:hypothetical protein
MTVNAPVIGHWFKRPNGTLFEVVAIDEEDATVEIQQFDGTIDELDIERWPQLLLTEVSAPEDWSEPSPIYYRPAVARKARSYKSWHRR